MLKNLFITVLILIAFPRGSMGDTAPDATIEKEKPSVVAPSAIQKETIEAAPIEIVPGKKNTVKDVSSTQKKATGPSYPFIYENKNEDQLACKVTPFVEFGSENKKPVKKSNNLIRKAGSAVKAEGNFIQIIGRLVDENCLPLQGAVVEIWQADALGNYEWEYDQDSYWQIPLEGKDKNFLFSGTALTDNLGQFDFKTIFPGSKDESAPHVNIIVKLTGYEGLHTRMYFANHPGNNTDPVLTEMQGAAKEYLIARGKNIGQYEGRIYYFPVTISGISPYKRF